MPRDPTRDLSRAAAGARGVKLRQEDPTHLHHPHPNPNPSPVPLARFG